MSDVGFSGDLAAVSHQTGWEFAGMIWLASVTIPSSLLVTSFIGLWFEKIKIKLFFWIAVLILLGSVGPIWIFA